MNPVPLPRWRRPMSAGRRRVLLSLGFLALAFLLAGNSVHAQQEPHKIWTGNLTPDQIKAALSRLDQGGLGDLDPLQQMLMERMQKDYPNIPRELLDAAIKKAVSDPKFMEQAKQAAKQRQTDPGRAAPWT